MCIRKEFLHTVCGHKNQTIQSCGDLNCLSTKDSTPTRRAFRVEVEGIEEAATDDKCRKCQIDNLIARDPRYYKLSQQWIQFSTEENLVAGYVATEAKKRFNEKMTQAFQQRCAVVARRLAANPLPVADLEKLPRAQRSCPYNHDAVDDNRNSEALVYVPCGHSIGSACVLKLLARGDPCPRPGCRKRFRFNKHCELEIRKDEVKKCGGG